MPVDIVFRMRLAAVADLPNVGTIQVSNNFYWWSRLSVTRVNGQTILKAPDVPGDNVSGLGTTWTTWNLQ